jgi:phosphohistidine phosphatase
VRLYILRHGPAEDHAFSGRDFDRALTASGRERVRDVGRALHEANEAPLLILSSPLVRALQTAEIVASMAKVAAPIDVRPELAPGGEARALVDELLASAKTSDRVMLVGHEPDLADLASTLSGRTFSAGLQKAMVVGLGARDRNRHTSANPNSTDATDTAKMQLRFVLDPKSLEWHYDTPPHTR